MTSKNLWCSCLLTIVITLSVLATPSEAAVGSDISFSSGGEVISAYVAAPDNPGVYPAIIAIHDWWGLTPWMRTTADSLANKGYLVMAVDLYRGQKPDNADAANRMSRRLPGERVTQDLNAAYEYLKSRQDVRVDKIATAGWSMGGGYALTMALSQSDLAACVISYGRVITEQASIMKINCPILGIFGEDDRSIPSRSVLSFQAACNKAGKTVTVHVIPKAGHTFMNELQPQSYRPEASERAWTHIHAFLRENLQ